MYCLGCFSAGQKNSEILWEGIQKYLPDAVRAMKKEFDAQKRKGQ